MDKTGEDWNGLNLGKFEKRGLTFFQIYISLYENVIYKAGKSFSVVMWPWFCKWKTLALPIWRLELIINKVKQNYLKKRDLAPLSFNLERNAIHCSVFKSFLLILLINYLWKMRSYPRFSFWILITLVEICFSRIFSKPRKNTFELVGTVLNYGARRAQSSATNCFVE